MATFKQCDRCKDFQRVLGHDFNLLSVEAGNEDEEGLRAELCAGCFADLKQFMKNLTVQGRSPESVLKKA